MDILMSTLSAAIGVALQRQWRDGSGYIDVHSLCCYWSCPAARDNGEMAVDILMSTLSAAIGVALQRQWRDGSG